jgi:hypothetical protein
MLALLIAPSAFAWKPTTHVFLSELALTDALDGKVTIHRVDYSTGKIVGTVGEYAVNAQLVAAIRANRAQFRAGVLGPDAQPDILTGQQSIHPDSNSVGGSNAWLQHIWSRSQGQSTAVRAYAAGFLSHAAGDMFAHTYVNLFAGGEFALGPNAARHITLESYLGKRTPALTDYQSSIRGCEQFIYDTMIRADSDSYLSQRLLIEPGAKFSVPRQYSDLRNRLQKFLDDHPAKSAAQRLVEKPALIYVRRWIADIDEGLQAWPGVSHEVAKALMFNSNGKADVKKATEILDDYRNNHLISMSGAPDVVGSLAAILGKLMDALLPTVVRDMMHGAKMGALDFVVRNSTGLTIDQFKGYAEHPEDHVDELLGPRSDSMGTGESRERISLRTLNVEQLHLRDTGYSNPSETFEWQTFAPAFNTVQMTKLMFLTPSEVNRLIRDLGGSGQLRGDNAMLGFMQSLDDGNQWQKNPQKMVAVTAGVYRKIFMRQKGDSTADSGPSAASLAGKYTGPDDAELTITVAPDGKLSVVTSRTDWTLKKEYADGDDTIELERVALEGDMDPQIPDWARKEIATSKKLKWRLSLRIERKNDPSGRPTIQLVGTFYPGKVTLEGSVDAQGAFVPGQSKWSLSLGPDEKAHSRRIEYTKG